MKFIWNSFSCLNFWLDDASNRRPTHPRPHLSPQREVCLCTGLSSFGKVGNNKKNCLFCLIITNSLFYVPKSKGHCRVRDSVTECQDHLLQFGEDLKSDVLGDVSLPAARCSAYYAYYYYCYFFLSNIFSNRESCGLFHERIDFEQQVQAEKIFVCWTYIIAWLTKTR